MAVVASLSSSESDWGSERHLSSMSRFLGRASCIVRERLRAWLGQVSCSACVASGGSVEAFSGEGGGES